jgi:hypothetical protein
MHHITDHWFWLLITMACVVWYSTITIYVAIRGVFDIKHMLGRLSNKRLEDVNSDNNNVK